MTLTRTTRSVLWCLALLAVAEWGLARAETALAPSGGLPVGRELWVVLGSSRSQRGVVPDVVAETLHERGRDEPWVINLSARGSTTVGLLLDYTKKLHPRMTSSLDARVLAIEVRASGLNDRYCHSDEQRGFDRLRSQDVDLEETFGAAVGSGLDLSREADLAWSQLRLSRARDIWHDWREPRTFEHPDWLAEGAGWMPKDDQRRDDLDAPAIRSEYTSRHLKDYTLGGMQTESLRRLVRRAHADGWRDVVIYVMPVTDVQREIVGAERWAGFLGHLTAVATEEGAGFLDLDTGHTLPDARFHDTHHLLSDGAREFSREWAQRMDDATR